MARDRYARLAVRAAASGRIDYKEANHRDTLWVVKENAILAEIEQESIRKLADFRHSQMLTLITAQLDTDALNRVNSILEDRFNYIGSLWMPWLKWSITDEDKQQAREEQAVRDREEWEKAFGSITSAKVQESERKAKFYLLAVRISARSRRENRKFSEQQRSFIDMAYRAQEGNRVAWKKISSMAQTDIVDLFSATFTRKDILDDVRKEFGE